MKARITIDDPAGTRWTKGEVGTVLANTYPEKYDYFIKLPGSYLLLIGSRITKCPRQYFFHANEVEVLK